MIAFFGPRVTAGQSGAANASVTFYLVIGTTPLGDSERSLNGGTTQAVAPSTRQLEPLDLKMFLKTNTEYDRIGKKSPFTAAINLKKLFLSSDLL